ncbi:EF-hand and coiled-coil domain-containing protein 1 [Hyla sarda]|uniref:EF-hand and coiled-coil domain-containing protein 1 n=1 Tax=Hyla sarda TaxID=327740 RepID=UPI0024C320A5|nr:EF-hand and coiled-coil domain-containing protein 1 [Hyla sarda]
MEPLGEQCSPLRPARRTQWLVSALAHHYGLDQGLDNEIIVLATGLDQYLQEVFHHLDWQAQGTISREEFRTLCRVLGLEPGIEECEELLEDLPERVSFRQFHARLCGYFSSRAGSARLPAGRENEQIQDEVRLRSPRVSRRENPRSRARSAGENELLRLQDENQHLRQVLEDLKGALQSSDARCLALQVGLYRSRASQPTELTATTANRRVLSESYTVTTRCVQREINVIQSTEDGQIEEVIKVKKDFEEKLSKTQKVLVYLEESNQQLLKEQAEMRRKVEDARQAVLASYSKVKDLEEKSRNVPVLQMHIDQLETQLQYYRSEESMMNLTKLEQHVTNSKPYLSLVRTEHRSPAEDTHADHNAEDQIFRSVEGQAASDEEEDKWAGNPSDAVQGILSSISCCASGCDDRRIWKLLTDIVGSDIIDPRDVPSLLVERISKLTEELTAKEQEMRDLEMLMEEIKGPFIDELERKMEEIELLRIDLQMLETERVRLSLVEEKLLDVLQLLHQLRNLAIPHQELGRVLLNTLERCREPQHGKEHIFDVLDTLYHELSVCELLHHHNEEDSGQSLAGSLVISC